MILDLGGAVGVLPPFGPFDLLYSQAAVIVALIHIHLPFMVLPLYAVLEKLDRRYVEASLDLGASHWRTFRLVILPSPSRDSSPARSSSSSCRSGISSRPTSLAAPTASWSAT